VTGALVLAAVVLGQARPPDTGAAGLERAAARMADRDYAGALKLLEQLAARGKPDGIVYYQIGVCQTVLGRFEEALASLERARAAGLEGPELRGSLGIARYNLGDNARAREELEGALAARPADPTVLLYLGRLDFKEQRYVDAEQRLRRVLALEPANTGALFALGRTLIAAGKTAEGKRVLERHRRLSYLSDRLKTLREAAAGPDAPAATLAELGDTCLELGDRAGAAAAYARAEGLEPSGAATSLGRGKLAYFAGDFEAAERQLSRAAAQPGRACEARLYLGLALRELRRNDPARRAFESAAADCPVEVRVLQNLAELEIQRGQLDHALELADAIERLDPDAPGALFVRAVCRLYRKDLDGAEKAALEAARLDAADPEYHRLLRAIYGAKGDTESARRHELEMQRLIGQRKVNP